MANIDGKKAVHVSTTELQSIGSSGPTATTAIQWPSDPQALTADPIVEIGLNIYDAILCTIPLLLIFKVILCLVAHETDKYAIGMYVDEVSNLTLYLIEFNKQLTTAFTIVFVTIITTLVRRLALWKAQKGATIAELEQLQASISLPSTFKMIWSLRAYTISSVVLVLVWSFYYLGSQASSREYTYQNSAPFSDTRLAFINSSAPSAFEPSQISSVTASTLASSNADFVYSFNLFQSESDPNGYDNKGYVLMPWLGQLGDEALIEEVQIDRHGWQDVAHPSNNQYTSSIGTRTWAIFPGYGLSDQMLGDFSFNSSYMVANCTMPTFMNASAFPNTIPTMSASFNMTSNNVGHNATTPRKFEIWDRSYNSSVLHSICNLTMEFVEVQVHCTATGCVAKKMRATQGDLPSLNQTPFDDDEFAYSFFNNLLLSGGVPGSLEDVTVPEIWDGMGQYIYAIENTPGEFGDYLTQSLSFTITNLINTYYQTSQNLALPSVDFGGHIISNGIINGSVSDPWFAHTNIKGAAYNPQYALSIPWITVDFISCHILFFAAVAAFWLRKRTLAPDIFGYVSSLTRDNPNLAIPDGGTALSGLERARLMKNVKVRIADIGVNDGSGSGGVGRVGFSQAERGQTHLQRDRRYI